VGDRVAVMTTEGVKEVRVISTGFYLENNVPYPIHLTSEIISKIHKSSNDEVVSDQKFYFQSTSYDKEIIKQIPSESLFEIENGELKAIKETSSPTIYIPLNVRSIISLFKISTKVVGGEGEYDDSDFVHFIPKGYLKVSMLENLYIPSSVRFATINSSIKNLFLSDGIEEINIDNYDGLVSSDTDFNFNLKTIYIPKSLKIINVDWSQIQEVYIDPKNEYFKLSNGILYCKYLKQENEKSYYVSRCEYVILWKNPKLKALRITENAIINFNWLIENSEIYIIDGVKAISFMVFARYSKNKLLDLHIPKSLEVIENSLFFSTKSEKLVYADYGVLNPQKFTSEDDYMTFSLNDLTYDFRNQNRLVHFTFNKIFLDNENESFTLIDGNLMMKITNFSSLHKEDYRKVLFNCLFNEYATRGDLYDLVFKGFSTPEEMFKKYYKEKVMILVAQSEFL
jgi:hypothetical protein